MWYVCSTRIDFVLDSGQQLRQDDPTALKDIVTLAQTRVAGHADTMRYHRVLSNPPPSHRTQFTDAFHDRDSEQPDEQ